MKTINVVSYHRVSTDIQDFTRQILDIETYCKAHNYTIVKSFGEKESGTKKERPELKNLLNYIKYNSVEYIIISELSRLARSNQVLNLIEQFHDLGIGLICLAGWTSRYVPA